MIKIFSRIRSVFKITLFCFTLILFQISGPITPRALALSVEEEEELGKEFLARVKQYFEMVEDDFANQFLNDLGKYLSTYLETRHFPFNFYIIKDNSLNAFAAPAGHIFVFSGLVEAMETLDQLASVICHELGHVSARHLSKRIEQNKMIGIATMAGILAGIFLGGKAGAALATGSLAAGMQTQLNYSRIDERQADQLGYKYMKDSGFNPGALIEALEKIERGSWLGSDKIPAYLLTHPKGPERMSNLESLLSNAGETAPKPRAEFLKTLFPFFKAVVRAQSMEPNEAERLFRVELEKDPEGQLPNFGLGLVYMEKSEYRQAIHFLKKAIERKEVAPVLTHLGEAYLMNGQNSEAISVFRHALELDNGDKAALYLLALSYEKAGDNRQSIEIFEKLVSLGSVKDEVYYHLGLSYGKSDRLGIAHYNFGLYFKKSGEVQKARFHFRKAEELSGNNPALIEKIRNEIKKIK